MIFFDEFPDLVFFSLLVEWLDAKMVNSFDSALCSKKFREQTLPKFINAILTTESIQQRYLNSHMTVFIKWANHCGSLNLTCKNMFVTPEDVVATKDKNKCWETPMTNNSSSFLFANALKNRRNMDGLGSIQEVMPRYHKIEHVTFNCDIEMAKTNASIAVSSVMKLWLKTGFDCDSYLRCLDKFSWVEACRISESHSNEGIVLQAIQLFTEQQKSKSVLTNCMKSNEEIKRRIDVDVFRNMWQVYNNESKTIDLYLYEFQRFSLAAVFNILFDCIPGLSKDTCRAMCVKYTIIL